MEGRQQKGWRFMYIEPDACALYSPQGGAIAQVYVHIPRKLNIMLNMSAEIKPYNATLLSVRISVW